MRSDAACLKVWSSRVVPAMSCVTLCRPGSAGCVAASSGRRRIDWARSCREYLRSWRSILALILERAATRLLAGSLIGVALAVGVNQALRSAIERLDWVPWSTMLVLTLLMAVVTSVAAVAPAMRATRVDPIRSLWG